MVNFNPTKRCLIVHEELQLGVCPSVVPCPLLVVLLFVVFGMVALETSQVLKRYGLRSDFLCESNQSLACDVENVLRYGFFSSTQPLEEAMSGTSAYAGYLCSGLSNAQTTVVQFAATNIQGLVGLGVYGDEDVLLPSVYPNDASCFFRFCLFNFNREAQPPLPLDKFEFGVQPLAFGKWSGLERNQFAPNAHAFLSDVEVPFPAQGDGCSFVGRQTPLAVGLHGTVGGDNMAEQRTGELGGQIEFLSDRSIELFGKVVWVVNYLSFEDDVRQPVGGFLVGSCQLCEPWMVAGDFQFVGSQSFHTTLSSKAAYENSANSKNYFSERRVASNSY